MAGLRLGILVFLLLYGCQGGGRRWEGWRYPRGSPSGEVYRPSPDLRDAPDLEYSVPGDARLQQVPLLAESLLVLLVSTGVEVFPLGKYRPIWAKRTDSPVVGGSVGERLLVVGTQGGEVLALDLRTGDGVWRADLGEEVAFAPLILGDWVFVGTREGHLWALSAVTGRERWRRALPGSPVGLAPVGSYLVVAISSGHLQAINIRAGEPLWGRSLPDAVLYPPVAQRGFLWVCTVSGRLLAFRRGLFQLYEMVWERDLGAPPSGPPVLAGGRLLVPLAFGEVVSLHPRRGTLQWRQVVAEGHAVFPPVVGGGTVYLATVDGWLCGLDLASGAVRWRWRVARSVDTPVAIAYGRLFVGVNDSWVAVLGPSLPLTP